MTSIPARLLLAAALCAAAAPSRAWTDEPLVPAVTKIRAVHVLELRTAINNKRTSSGMTAYVWTDPTLAPGAPIRAVHIQDLRTALTQLDVVLGCPPPVFTDPVLTPRATKIRAVHIEELRAAFDGICSSQCYACQNTGALTCAISVKPPNAGGACPAGYSNSKPAACFPGCFACTAWQFDIDSGHACLHCGTACGSLPASTCWNIVDAGPLWGICPYCPAPPSCWSGASGLGKDPTDIVTACAVAQAAANAPPSGGRSSCGLSQNGNYGASNTCDCFASCLTAAPSSCP